MREGAVTRVVQERGGARGGAGLVVDVVLLCEAVEDARHQMERAERVREARVLRALIGEEGEAELFDAPEALELEGVYEAHHQAAFVSVGAEADDIVDGIAVDALAHGEGSLAQAIADFGLRNADWCLMRAALSHDCSFRSSSRDGEKRASHNPQSEIPPLRNRIISSCSL